MTERRRSSRHAVALPVRIKGALRSIEAVTADVSLHGVSVDAGGALVPEDKHVDLELRIPGRLETVAVTATRTRSTLLARDTVAFDFFLFDGRSALGWRTFLESLSFDEAKTPDSRQKDDIVDDEALTFIVRPRTLARLWSLYRNELLAGRVRIETPVMTGVGTSVEVLVVHPESGEEWPLRGFVRAASEAGRGRGPLLEIELFVSDDLANNRFRRFVATGSRETAQNEDPQLLSTHPFASLFSEYEASGASITVEGGRLLRRVDSKVGLDPVNQKHET